MFKFVTRILGRLALGLCLAAPISAGAATIQPGEWLDLRFVTTGGGVDARSDLYVTIPGLGRPGLDALRALTGLARPAFTMSVAAGAGIGSQEFGSATVSVRADVRDRSVRLLQDIFASTPLPSEFFVRVTAVNLPVEVDSIFLGRNAATNQPVAAQVVIEPPAAVVPLPASSGLLLVAVGGLFILSARRKG